MQNLNRPKHSSPGFTLLEVALVVLVSGLGLGAAALAFSNYLKALNMETTQQRLQAIDNALIAYLNVNGVLPCVARLNDNTDSASFGKQIDVLISEDCYDASLHTPGTFHATNGRTPPPAPTNLVPGLIVIGAVPTRTLNLPDSYMKDAWGSRFIYAVTDVLTVKPVLSQPGGYDPTQGAIDVKDGDGISVLNPAGSAQYVIVSHGPNKAGGYTAAGKQGAPCPASAVESPNCSFPTNSFVKSLSAGAGGSIASYDDYILFRGQMSPLDTTPTGLIAPFALTTCPPGWAVFAGFPTCANETPGVPGVCCQKLN